jgi:hypothetical protein
MGSKSVASEASKGSKVSIRNHRERMKDKPMQYVIDPEDTKDILDLKYAMRIQDLERIFNDSNVAITPDPRLRAANRQVRLDLFLGDFRANKKN